MLIKLDSNDFTTLISGGVIQVPQMNLRIALDDIGFQVMQDSLDRVQDQIFDRDSEEHERITNEE